MNHKIIVESFNDQAIYAHVLKNFGFVAQRFKR